MKTPKVKLDYMPNVNFQIVGISSSEMDYKLAYNLNRGFDTDFYLLPDIVMEKEVSQAMPALNFGSDSEANHYSVYGNAIDSFKKSALLLISNKDRGSFLLDEFRSFDYLFIIRDDSSFGYDASIKTLRSLDCISGAYGLPFERIKSKKSIYILWDSLQNRQ